MAYYAFEEGFEQGVAPLVSAGKGAFATKTDTGGRMLFPGPRQLQADGYRIAPYRGGGLCRVDFMKSAADAYLVADAGWDVGGTNTMFFRLMVMPYMLNLSSSDDGFDIFRGISSGPVTTYSARITWQEPQGMVLANSIGQSVPIQDGVWTCVEGEVKAGAGGYIKLYVEGATLVNAPATVAAITDFHLGVLGQTGTITQGSVCFDEVLVPTIAKRLYPPQGPRDALNLDGANLRMRKSGFAFVGAGEILQLQLIAESGSNNKVYVYDTATPSFSESDLADAITVVTSGLTKPNQSAIKVQRGAWVEISGDDPLVLLKLGQIGETSYYEDYSSSGDMGSSVADTSEI